jgi:hypothetical protein
MSYFLGWDGVVDEVSLPLGYTSLYWNDVWVTLLYRNYVGSLHSVEKPYRCPSLRGNSLWVPQLGILIK